MLTLFGASANQGLKDVTNFQQSYWKISKILLPRKLKAVQLKFYWNFLGYVKMNMVMTAKAVACEVKKMKTFTELEF